MKIRSTAIGAVAAAAALAATLVPHPDATASAHLAARGPLPGRRRCSRPSRATTPPTQGPNWSDGFANQTVRQVIRVSSGGSQVRVRLSNLYGTKPLQVTGATIARTRDGATVEPGTVRSLTFHGARSATIPAGRVAASDPAALPVAALESLTITLFFAGSTGPSTFHEDGLTASYRAAGDHRFDARCRGVREADKPFLLLSDRRGRDRRPHQEHGRDLRRLHHEWSQLHGRRQ